MRGLKISNVKKKILEIALPSMGSSLIGMLYGIVDLMWIGRLGKEAIASVTLAVSLFNMNFILNEIFGVASVVMLARRWGEKNKKDFEIIGRQIVLYKFMAGVFMVITMLPAAYPILKWMGGDKVPISSAYAYYFWRLLFLPFSFMGGTMMTTFRSIGDTKSLFVITLIWGSVNIVLDPALMFGMKLGVVGSAIASGICETSSMITGFLVAKRKWDVWLLKPEKLHIDILKKVFKIGGPSLLDSINWNASRLVVVKIVSSLGVLETAVFGIFLRIVEMGWMMGFAFEGAITTLVGQSLGRGDKDAARDVFKEGLLITTIVGLMIFAIVFTFSGGISRLFTDEVDLLKASKYFLKVSSFSLFFMLILNAFYGVLVGGGRTMDTFYIGLVLNWGVRIPSMMIAASLTKSLNFLGVLYGLSIGLGAVFGYIIVKKEKWLETIV